MSQAVDIVSKQTSNEAKGIIEAMRVLGVCIPRSVRVVTYWRFPSWQLHDWYEQCRENFHRATLECHPDRAGGNRQENQVRLNLAWDLVNRRYAAKGYGYAIDRRPFRSLDGVRFGPWEVVDDATGLRTVRRLARCRCVHCGSEREFAVQYILSKIKVRHEDRPAIAV
jgi:hypothetical protein